MTAKYHFLQALDLTVWVERAKKTTPGVLVVLSKPMTHPHGEHLFKKMLQCIDLMPAQYDQFIIDSVFELQTKIEHRMPEAVLALGFSDILCSKQVVQTFHPNDLFVSPQHKAEAYKQLLRFKSLL